MFGVVAPKNTAVAIIDKLNIEINAGLADPRIRARLAEPGATALVPGTFDGVTVVVTGGGTGLFAIVGRGGQGGQGGAHAPQREVARFRSVGRDEHIECFHAGGTPAVHC